MSSKKFIILYLIICPLFDLFSFILYLKKFYLLFAQYIFCFYLRKNNFEIVPGGVKTGPNLSRPEFSSDSIPPGGGELILAQ